MRMLKQPPQSKLYQNPCESRLWAPCITDIITNYQPNPHNRICGVLNTALRQYFSSSRLSLISDMAVCRCFFFGILLRADGNQRTESSMMVLTSTMR
mmetsp:Transcript_33603/g.63180  ORF Transcript_33603/g.63180 Transcript_33603/m.63180 type:complete len:97 (+) Transcript_33603:47-337(+)